MKDLIGKKIKGFKFKFNSKNITYDKQMDNYIGKIGVIINGNDSKVFVKFDDKTCWTYPLPEALKHIVEEHPQRGDEVLVWDDDERKAVKRIFITYIEGSECPVIIVSKYDEVNFKKGNLFSIDAYKNYKPIPQKTKLTLQQIADKFGIDVNDLEVEI